MIKMLLYHFLNTVVALPVKIGILHPLQYKAPGMIFLPYHHSPLITKVKKSLIIGIMTGSDRIGAYLQHHIHILIHNLKRHCTA